jgi:hypothetical protein
MADEKESPRVLRLTFELQVPAGLRRNIRGPRIDAAITTFIGVIQGVATNAFPWASSMTVRSEWSYAWRDRTEKVDLATTELNAGPFSSKGDESDPDHGEPA